MEWNTPKTAKQIEEWIPLVMDGRDPNEEVTATRMVTGTDVDYGALTNELLDSLRGTPGFSMHFLHRVEDLRRDGGLWNVRIREEQTGRHWDVQTKFVFIRAGAAAELLYGDGAPATYHAKVPTVSVRSDPHLRLFNTERLHGSARGL